MVFGAIEKAIYENAIQKMVMSSITGALDIYEKYIRSTNSTIVYDAVRIALHQIWAHYESTAQGMLDEMVDNTSQDEPAQDEPAQDAPAQDAPAQDAPAQDAPKKGKKAKSSK